MSIRLDRFLADACMMTRSEAQKAIRAGRVADCAGRALTAPELKISPEEGLLLDGAALNTAQGAVCLMVYKPDGVLSATEDKHDTTVFDLLPESYARAKLSIVGRLDKDSEGLLLLTADGELNHRLTSPKRHVPKTYLVRTDRPPDAADAQAFETGIDLGDFVTKPGTLTVLPDEPCAALVTISEGKFRQIRRMFASRGKEVTFLKRLSIGSLRLDETLQPGEFRFLNGEEKSALYRDVHMC